MNRKKFISTVLPLGLSASGLSQLSVVNPAAISSIEEENKTTAPYLKKGDTIGITCPGGFISLEEIQPAVNKMKEWGYKVKVGNTVLRMI